MWVGPRPRVSAIEKETSLACVRRAVTVAGLPAVFSNVTRDNEIFLRLRKTGYVFSLDDEILHLEFWPKPFKQIQVWLH